MNACDFPEACTGTSAACPPDTGEPDTDGDGVSDAVELKLAFDPLSWNDFVDCVDL